MDELISVDMDHGHLQGQHTVPKATAETQKKDNESESEGRSYNTVAMQYTEAI